MYLIQLGADDAGKQNQHLHTSHAEHQCCWQYPQVFDNSAFAGVAVATDPAEVIVPAGSPTTSFTLRINNPGLKRIESVSLAWNTATPNQASTTLPAAAVTAAQSPQGYAITTQAYATFLPGTYSLLVTLNGGWGTAPFHKVVPVRVVDAVQAASRAALKLAPTGGSVVPVREGGALTGVSVCLGQVADKTISTVTIAWGLTAANGQPVTTTLTATQIATASSPACITLNSPAPYTTLGGYKVVATVTYSDGSRAQELLYVWVSQPWPARVLVTTLSLPWKIY